MDLDYDPCAPPPGATKALSPERSCGECNFYSFKTFDWHEDGGERSAGKCFVRHKLGLRGTHWVQNDDVCPEFEPQSEGEAA